MKAWHPRKSNLMATYGIWSRQDFFQSWDPFYSDNLAFDRFAGFTSLAACLTLVSTDSSVPCSHLLLLSNSVKSFQASYTKISLG
ncbi:hypothetical protein BpHYR1_019827 [Brachionus plicatilis]|uniref:Uncharacterized protein n=1 Tax=Brachionus plicatilis TaxID=10195 RepID=A0A3M7PFX0_BRAPC|nr:hypothetical protein BpHYR1_019827 [Brachionus plicatilis]